jgi:hypothetical protein
MGLGDLMAELLGEIEFAELASSGWAEPVKSEILIVKNAVAVFGLYVDFDRQPSADDIAARIAEYKRFAADRLRELHKRMAAPHWEPEDRDAAWVWAELMKFKRTRIMSRNPTDLLRGMSQHKKYETSRLAPALVSWLQKFAKAK